MDISTGRGDEGETDLMGGDRVLKTNPRIEAYGTVDEVNCALGAISESGYEDVDEYIHAMQNHLHIIQAELSSPDDEAEMPEIASEHIESIEEWIDVCEGDLDPLGEFILPGGSEVGARLHNARAVARRAERRAVALAEQEEVNEQVLTYLNRVSDFLFVLARLVNKREGVPEDTPTY